MKTPDMLLKFIYVELQLCNAWFGVFPLKILKDFKVVKRKRFA